MKMKDTSAEKEKPLDDDWSRFFPPDTPTPFLLERWSAVNPRLPGWLAGWLAGVATLRGADGSRSIDVTRRVAFPRFSRAALLQLVERTRRWCCWEQRGWPREDLETLHRTTQRRRRRVVAMTLARARGKDIDFSDHRGYRPRSVPCFAELNVICIYSRESNLNRPRLMSSD